MFEEAGVAEPTDDWTWDDYANAANTIHDKLGIYGCSSMLSSEFIAGCSVYIFPVRQCRRVQLLQPRSDRHGL